MRMALIAGIALVLAGCGADGEPVQPAANANVTLSSSGVHVGTNLRLNKGPFSVNLGLGL